MLHIIVRMNKHLSMGALNKQTNEYEYPAIASKLNSYKCPHCSSDVILKKGEIKRHHFAHKTSEKGCTYYERPNESQIHKDAKNLLYSLLKSKTELNIKRKCVRCNGIYHVDGEWKGHTISKNNYEDGDPIPMLEYSFNFNGKNKRADVALVYESSNVCDTHIFEICHTNPTLECDRPEPWFEFNALTLINDINNQIEFRFAIDLFCLRQPNENNKCSMCIEHQQKFEREQHIKQLRRIEEEKREQIEREKKLEEARLRQIEIIKQNEEEKRLNKLREEEEQKKELELKEQRIKKLETDRIAHEEKLDEIRRKYPGILKVMDGWVRNGSKWIRT